MNEVVRGERYDVFLGQRLDGVGDRLKQTVRSGPVWAVTVLQSAEALAFKPGGDGEQEREGDQDGYHRKDCGTDGLGNGWNVAEQPMFGDDKYLVEREGHFVWLPTGSAGADTSGAAALGAAAEAEALASAA